MARQQGMSTKYITAVLFLINRLGHDETYYNRDTYIHIHTNAKIKVTLSQWLLQGHCTGTKLLSVTAVAQSSGIGRTKQCRLQFPAEQQQQWNGPDRQRQGIPGTCRCHREGTVTKCGASLYNIMMMINSLTSSCCAILFGLISVTAKTRKTCQ